MITDCPDPKEVADFHFRQLRTLNILKDNEKIPSKSVNLLASASKYALLFVGIEEGFKVLRLEDVLIVDEDKENRSIEKNYPRCFVRSGTPVILAVNANQTTLAVCTRSATGILINLYSVSSYPESGAAWQPFCSNTLSSSAELQDFSWNPTAENIYSFCLSDGSLHVHEVVGTSIKSVASLQAANIISVCWSPKGKQLVAGKQNGSFSQYKPNLQEVKTVVPPLFEDNAAAVSSICWISTTVFAVVYVTDGMPSLFIVSTPKDSPVMYTNFNDICLGNNSTSDQKYFLHLEPSWGILICASLDSIEIAVLGDMPHWVQWDLREDGKALLPGKDGATHAIGMTVMYSAQNHIVISESESYPPMPIMFLLTNNGLLVSFHMINTKSEIATLVSPPLPWEFKKAVESESSSADAVPAIQKLQPQTPRQLEASFISENVSVANQMPVLQNNKLKNANISDSAGVMRDSAFSQTDKLKESSHLFGGDMLVNSLNKLEGVPNISNQKALERTRGNVDASFNVAGKQNEVQFSTDDSYMVAIVSEIQNFVKELQDLKQLQNSAPTMDGEEDMISLKTFALNLHNFQNDIHQTMQSISSDIYTLKNVLLESFAMVEEACSRERRKNDHSYITLLKERSLDPVTAKRMQKMNQHYQYLRTQLQEVSDRLDQDWIHLISNKKKSIRSISSTEAIYKTIVNNQNIIHKLRIKVQVLMKKVEERKLRNTTKSGTWGKYHKRSTQEDLSKLADEFLQVKIAYPEEGDTPVTKKLSRTSQDVLKSFLKESSVATVRPTAVYSPSQSRLISNAVLSEDFYASDQEKVVSPEQVPIQPPSVKADSLMSAGKSVATEMSSKTALVDRDVPVYEPVTPPENVNTHQPLSKVFTVCSTMMAPLSLQRDPKPSDVRQSFSAVTSGSSPVTQRYSVDQSYCLSTSIDATVNKGLPVTAFTVGANLPPPQIVCSSSASSISPKIPLFASGIQTSSECAISKPLVTAISHSVSNFERKDPFYSVGEITSSSTSEPKTPIASESLQTYRQTTTVPSCMMTSNISPLQNNSFTLAAVASQASPVVKHPTQFATAQTLQPFQKSLDVADPSDVMGKNENLFAPRSPSDPNTNSSLVSKNLVDSKSPGGQEHSIAVQKLISSPLANSFVSSSDAAPGNTKSDASEATEPSAKNASIVSHLKPPDSSNVLVSNPSVIFSPVTVSNVALQSVSTENVITVSSSPSIGATNFGIQLTPAASKIPLPSVSTLSSETSSGSTVSLFGQNVTICSPVSSDATKKTESSVVSPFGTTPTSFAKPTSSSEAPSLFHPTTTTVTTTADVPPAFVQTSTAQTSSFGQSSHFPAEGFFSQAPAFAAPPPTTATNSDLNGQASTFSFGKPAFGQATGSFGLAKSFSAQNATPVSQSGTSASNFSFSQNSNPVFGQGSFFSGLGGKPSEENASKNVFGMSSGIKSADTSNLFRNAATSFGAVNSGTPFSGTGSFSGGGGSVAQSGFGSFQQSPVQQPQATATGFGASPTFGSTPAFGSAPMFGASPTFGSGSLTSVFGQQQVSSNFSNFANASSPTFGSLASQSSGFSNPPLSSGFGTPPTFGSLSFGNQTSGFGSPGSPPSNSSAFTQWRN